MNYKKRLIDKVIDLKMDAFCAVNIVGPKGCGKTETAKQRCKTKILFEDEDNRENYIKIANNKPSYLLEGEKPILFDEWQDAPKIWGAIRTFCDNNPEKLNSFYLTGSSSKKIILSHTGTLRIAEVKMYPMSLYETEESTGEISLTKLFDNSKSFKECKSKLSFDSLIFAICRGGWPRYLYAKTKKSQLTIAEELFNQTCKNDINHIDGITRNEEITRNVLKSYSRNICTIASTSTLLKDIKISETTLTDYISALKKLYIIEDIDSWNPSIRSKTAIRSNIKRNLIDPSIGIKALGISPEYLKKDFKTLGFFFESLCIRDLKIYSSSLGGRISYYRDRYGLECDCVLHLEDGRYALIEFKLGENEIEEGAKHLCKIEELVKQYNLKNDGSLLREPDLKIIITASDFAYKRDDGVFIIPISCLKE